MPSRRTTPRARSGDANRLGDTTALDAAASPRTGKTFREILASLAGTFAATTRRRRTRRRIHEPFVLRLRDHDGLSIRIDQLDPAVAAVARAIAANVRGDRGTSARLPGPVCERTAIQHRICVLACCVARTTDLLGRGARPPRRSSAARPRREPPRSQALAVDEDITDPRAGLRQMPVTDSRRLSTKDISVAKGTLTPKTGIHRVGAGGQLAR